MKPKHTIEQWAALANCDVFHKGDTLAVAQRTLQLENGEWIKRDEPDNDNFHARSVWNSALRDNAIALLVC